MALWLVRGGSYGEHESKFIDESKVCLTWGELTATDMTGIPDYDGIKQRVTQLFPNEPVRKLGNWSGQVWAFVLAMKDGDWIVMPRKNKATIAIGEVKSKCKFDASAPNDYKHYREIKWLDTEIPRSNFDQDVLYSFGAFLTVCEIKRNDAEARVRAMAKNGWHVPAVGATKAKIVGTTDGNTATATATDEAGVDLVAKDLVDHFEARTTAMPGKAMVVCMSRRICIKLHDAIVKLRPQWYSKDDTQGAIKVVMTGAASDPLEWQEHIGNKQRRDTLAGRARDPKDDLKIVIVRDMWLTGFDAPCMHTMYVDKPMRGHGLMQAIARVNRVFKDKQGGLIVDYIGIAQNLKSALQIYSPGDRDKTGIDESQAVAVMQEKYEVVRDMFYGYDYRTALDGTPQERMLMMAGAIEWVLDMQQKLAAQEKTEDKKKQAHRRYQDAVLALSKAFSLASASDEARGIREEVGFFQAIRAALVKSAIGSGAKQQDKDMAIQQIVSRAVISTEIVDILAATGLKSPDISILSEDFLAELQQMERKNLALEALKKLLNDGIRSRSKTNVVETKGFTERLENAVARYHANAITTAEVLQELIELAKDIRAARARGEDSGLSDDEIAFYDALAENSSAVQMMGNDQLKLIAHELLESLKANVSVDWAHRENARARLRVLVKRILKKYGYPPDLQDQAVQTVLQQAEALSAMWSSTGSNR